jgi:tRNA pseudouridine38-40 synthase
MSGDAHGRRLALLLEYDGSRYGGSQYQRNAPTIQAELESALSSLTGESTRLALAGRTDAGVHAKGQVASFLTASHQPPSVFRRGLNYHLPEDIAVRAVAEVSPSLDVRRHAESRLYRYTICNGGQRSPLWRRFAWQMMGERLDVEVMREAARCLRGRHDFAAFTQPSLKGRRPTVRLVSSVRVVRRGRLLLFDMEANAFLPRQVRRSVGTLVQVGLGRLTSAEFRQLVESAPPGAASFAAPAHGLCLLKVRYERELFENDDEEDEDL